MSLGGVDGFLNLCQSLRSFDELKFTYTTSAGKYDEIETAFPLNINKKQYGGTLCFHIETINGDNAMIAQNTCSELLKFENVIVAAIKKMALLVPDAESKFNELVSKAAADFSKALTDIEKSGDLLLIEIITNFNDLLKMCVDEKNKFNATTTNTTSAKTAPKRKRNLNPVKRAKKSKDDHNEHNYVQQEEDEIEVQEVTTDDSALDDPTADDTANDNTNDKEILPLGLIESGQRVESELYL